MTLFRIKKVEHGGPLPLPGAEAEAAPPTGRPLPRDGFDPGHALAHPGGGGRGRPRLPG